MVRPSPQGARGAAALAERWIGADARAQRFAPLLAPLLALALACGTEAPKTEVIREAPAPRVGKAAPRKATSKYPQVDACPTRLEGIERVDRLIRGSCGRVVVARGYRLDAGSFTVEPGVTLAFETGADLALGFGDQTRVSIVGTADAPVILSAAADAPVAGAWAGIRLYKGAAGAVFDGVVVEYASDPDRGAFHVEAQDVTIERSRLREIAGLAVYVTSTGGLRRFAATTIEAQRGPTAMFLPAAAMGGLAADNVFPETTSIRVLGDVLHGKAHWPAPGVPVIVAGRIEIAGTAESPASVTLAAGLELRFDHDGYINVGYHEPGILVVAGTADKPVIFSAHREDGDPLEAGAWRGINLYKHASASFTHAVFEYGGRFVDRGVLYANSEAEVSVTSCTFRKNRAGVVLARDDVRLHDFTDNRFQATPRPLSIDPAVFGALGVGNVFGGEGILLSEGAVEENAIWRDPGAIVEVGGPITVDGATLTIDAGVRLRVRDGFSLEIGRRSPAVLQIEGTPESPVEIAGVHDKRGTWDAIIFYTGSRGSALRHLDLVNAGGVAAVDVRADADVTVQGLSCARCFSPALTWECGAAVDQRGVTIAGGTPSAILAPSCGS